MKKKQHFPDIQWSGNNKLLLNMKLTFIFIFLSVATMAVNTYSQEARFDLKVENESIIQVFDEIERVSEFGFLFKTDQLDLTRKYTLDFKNVDIEMILKEVLNPDEHIYRIIDRNIVITRIDSNINQNNNSKNVSGKVTDSSGLPLPGVSVVLKGTTTGATTDVNGSYSIPNVPENATLQFSFMGMKKEEVTVGEKTIIDIILTEDAIGMDEVVVVGYGTVKKSDLTGAVSSVTSRDLMDLPNSNILDQVQGRIPGLMITNTNAAPGADQSILIRGINSITASTYPLIILDGIPYDGNISTINPSDIESFNVLKDASSTAIYGSRGSNGVIIITTKKGNEGKLTIAYDGKYSVNSMLKKIDVLNADQYKAYKEAFNTPLQISELDNYQNQNFTDWQDIATRDGLQTDHVISIKGGTDKFNIYSSLGRLDETGILKGSGYNRTSFRTNGSYSITDWLEIGTQLQLTDEDWGTQGHVNLNHGIRMSPLGTPYNEDGTNTLYPIPEDKFFTNPLDALNVYNHPTKRRILTNLFSAIKFPFLNGLSYRINYGRSEQRNEQNNYNPSTTVAGLSQQGSAGRNYLINLNMTFENIIKYNRSFGNHLIDLTGLYSFQEGTGDGTNTSGSTFINDNLSYFGVGTGMNKSISTTFWKTNIISQMGRLNYSFNSKYSLTYTIRRDGYSGFGTNNKWGIFSSGALAWTISEESFLENVKWLDFLKLRASYGSSGNQAIGAYGTLTRVTQGRSYYFDNTVVTFAPTSLGNPSLGWESTNTMNFGLDFELFKTRLSGTIEYYETGSNGLILSRKLNSTQGFSSILQNIAQVENRGVELNLNGVIISQKNFNWKTNVTYSRNRNQIVKLFDKESDDIGNNWFIGQDINVNYGYVFDGVFKDQDQIANSAQPTAKPGDVIIKDVDKDGIITPEDRTFQGSRSPKYTIGINNTFSYKQFYLSMFIYSLQGAMVSNPLLEARNWDQRVNYLDIDFWTPNNTTAKYPSPAYQNSLGILYLEDRSFIRIKNITLGYTFKKSLIQHLGLDNLRMFVAGDNLFTKTKWSGYDPETSTNPFQLESYPSSKSIVFGINIGI